MEQELYYTVLVWPGGDRRVKKIAREPKWGTSSPSMIMLESEDGIKETLHQKRVRQRRKIWQILAWQFAAHFLKLFRPPLCHLHRYISSPAPSIYTLHVVTTVHISGYSTALGILCACVFLVKLMVNLTEYILYLLITLIAIITHSSSYNIAHFCCSDFDKVFTACH